MSDVVGYALEERVIGGLDSGVGVFSSFISAVGEG